MAGRKLGYAAFIAHDDGSVTRTIVISVALDGSADYLEHSYKPYHLLFKDAAASAMAALKAKEKELEEALRAVRKTMAEVASPGYEQAVLNAPLKRIPGTCMWPTADVEMVDVPAPESYFEPGTRVFGVVTPSTLNTMHSHYRPAAYFVLESTIREARLFLDSTARYRLDSYYHIDKLLFSDVEEAKRALVRVFEEETKGSLSADRVRVVSQEEEKEADGPSTKRIAGKVKSQFGQPASAGD